MRTISTIRIGGARTSWRFLKNWLTGTSRIAICKRGSGPPTCVHEGFTPGPGRKVPFRRARVTTVERPRPNPREAIACCLSPPRREAAGEKGTQAMTSEAKWPIYSLKLKTRSEVAERTLEFRFDKPAGMTFKAGQFMELTLIDPPETDAEGNTRGFSINSAPDDPELTFTTRLRDTAFKRRLQTMPLGAEIKVEGPFGNLTLHNDPSRPAVFLAGGIGITPF